MDRRLFLGAVPAAMIVGHRVLRDERVDPGAVSGRPGEEASPRLDRWGVQLYTLRSLLAEDVEGTLATIADIGYSEVELAGLYGLSARDMRSRLDDVGLSATSSHHDIDAVRGDWGRSLDEALELGQSQVVVPWLGGADRTAEGLRRVADDFNRGGEAASQVGLRFGYHNHDFELQRFDDGTVPMDFLLERTEPTLVDWQMDIFWLVHGGADPLDYLDRYPGRFRSVHVKDRSAGGDMVDVGDGTIDFAPILERAERDGLRHAYVEHDDPADAVETVRRSYRHLVGLRRGA
jgi:sugar phosphate isomerase/epimerase